MALCSFLVAPSSHSYRVSSKEAQCAFHERFLELNEVKKTHARMMESRNGFQLFEMNTLMNMYLKCGSIGDARNVFDNILKRNVVTWNLMILAYAKKDEGVLALDLYTLMLLEGLQPSDRTFVGALKACGSLAGLEEGTEVDGKLVKMRSLEKCRAIHSRVVKNGFESNKFVASTLIDQYAKCGSIVDAWHVFDKLPHLNVLSWNAMIRYYAEKQESAAALQLYGRMQQEGIIPDDRTFVAALKACSSLAGQEEGAEGDAKYLKLQCLEKGRAIHFRALQSGFESDLFLGNTLIDMYAKCGSILDARHVFDLMPLRNVVSWTAMIQGYAERQEGELALQLYALMQRQGIKPDYRSLFGVLKACSCLSGLEEGTEVDGKVVKLRCLEKGRAIHFRAVACDLESSVFVGNTLIDMYVKCGCIMDARYVFDMMPHRNVVSWTSMILGYAGKHDVAALELYAQMQHVGCTPNDRTFGGALKACSSLATQEEATDCGGKFVKIRCLEKGRSIHSQAMKSGLESDTFIGNALVDMYVKCGSIMDAQHAFHKLLNRDVVSWTAMIMGYAEKQEGEVALRLYSWMQEESVVPDAHCFVGALKACGSLAALEEGKQVDGKFLKIQCLEKGRAIHSQVVKNGYESNTFVGTTLVDVYAKCGAMVDARHVFDKLPHRDVVSWNAMIQGYVEHQEGEVVLQLYTQMQQESVMPDDRTFVCAMMACSSLAALEEGKQADGKVLKICCLEKGRAIHSHVVKNGFESHGFVRNALIDMYSKCGSVVDARHVFDKLPLRDVISWGAMILGYVEQGDNHEALKLYAQMQEQGLSVDSWIFVTILRACSNIAALETGKEIHAQICIVGLETTTIVANSLIDMYAKCGSMVDAQQLFDALPSRDLVTWSALIAGYARQGDSELVFHFFEKMRQEGIKPDRITFLSVLTVCSHVGLVDKGKMFFEAMSKEYALTPSIEHCTCMVDLFGRAGQIDKAVVMVEKLHFKPDIVIWLSVLGACQKFKNVEAGRRAFECAVRLDERHAAAYVLMANIYADAHMWEERSRIQAMRKKALAWKMPGRSSWTDQSGIVHTFVVGDTKHPQIKDIHANLKDLSVMMEEDYVRQLDSV